MPRPHTAVTILIQGPLQAPTQQIFTNALPGQGTVMFPQHTSTTHAPVMVYPDWWGAIGDGDPGSAALNGAAIQAALNGAPAGCVVQLLAGVYTHSSPLTIYPPEISLTFRGVGRSGTSLCWTGGAVDAQLTIDSDREVRRTFQITSVAIASNVLTITANNDFAIGTVVTFLKVATAIFLNGQKATILTVTATQFTAKFTHEDYGPTVDTGQVVVDDIGADATDIWVTDLAFNNTGAAQAAIQVNGVHTFLERLRSWPFVAYSDSIVRTFNGNNQPVLQLFLRDSYFIGLDRRGEGYVPVGFTVFEGVDIRVRNCFFESFGINAVRVSDVGDRNHVVGGFSMDACQVDSHGHEDPNYVGVRVSFAQNFSIRDCYMNLNGDSVPGITNHLGILVEHCEAGLIQGNFFNGDGQTYNAIRCTLASAKHVTVEANQFHNFNYRAIGALTVGYAIQLTVEITKVAVASNVLTITANNDFAISTVVNFLNVATAIFLNGQKVTILTVTATQFTATFTHADYGPTPDTGQVVDDGTRSWHIGDNAATSTTLGVVDPAALDGVIAYQNSRILGRSVSLTDVVSTAAETSVFTRTIPARTLGAVRALRLSLIGSYVNNSGAPADFTVRIKFGTTTIYSSGSLSLPSSAGVRALLLDAELSGANSDRTQVAKAHLVVGAPNTEAGVGDTPAFNNAAMKSPVTEESTVDKDLVVTVQHGVALASLEARILTVQLELV
jgi:hypothetical protein